MKAAQQTKSALKSPVEVAGQRKSRLQFDANGTLTTDSNTESNFPASDQQNQRKVVRLQPTPMGVWNSGLPDDFNGDISITSAKLTAAHSLANSSASGGLVVQASNQSPSNSMGANANFIRSVPQSEPILLDQSALSGDFFQNRTIADIMEDSGLRIDGQQVTFLRLKECLRDELSYAGRKLAHYFYAHRFGLPKASPATGNRPPTGTSSFAFGLNSGSPIRSKQKASHSTDWSHHETNSNNHIDAHRQLRQPQRKVDI